jgi:hypothetical protein
VRGRGGLFALGAALALLAVVVLHERLNHIQWGGIGLSLAAIWLFMKRIRKPSTVPEIDPEMLSRYSERIEKDLSKLD